MFPITLLDDQNHQQTVTDLGQLRDSVDGIGSRTRYVILKDEDTRQSGEFSQSAVALRPDAQVEPGKFLVEYRNQSGHHQIVVGDHDAIFALLSAWVSDRTALPTLAEWAPLKY
jgi:hypothetical protein